MPPMFKRMAIWAKNFKVRQGIVFPISIFVMAAQYLWDRIIPATFAPCNHASQFHVFPGGTKSGVPNFLFRFIYAFYATINSRFGRASQKFNSAMFTIAANRPFKSLRFVIAFPTAIFCCVCPRRDMSKLDKASFTICSFLDPCCKAFAASRAILETVKSVFRNINKSFAMPAAQVFASKGF